MARPRSTSAPRTPVPTTAASSASSPAPRPWAAPWSSTRQTAPAKPSTSSSPKSSTSSGARPGSNAWTKPRPSSPRWPPRPVRPGAPMGLEHFDAVLEQSGQSGASLTVLLVIARHSGPHGEWIADQPTLQKQARLSRRGIQLVLAQLVAAGELAVVSHHGRGKRSIYRLLVGEPAVEKAQPGAPFSPPKGEAPCAFAATDIGEADCAFSPPKGEPGCAFP